MRGLSFVAYFGGLGEFFFFLAAACSEFGLEEGFSFFARS